MVPRLAAFKKDRRRVEDGSDGNELRLGESDFGDIGGIVRDVIGKMTFDALNL